MTFPEIRPSHSDLLKDDRNFIKLSGFLVRQQVDRISTRIKDGHCMNRARRVFFKKRGLILGYAVKSVKYPNAH